MSTKKKSTYESIVREIKRKTRRKFTAEEKIRIVSFIEEHKVIDKIINHLKLSFKAERPPPPQAQLSIAAEELSEYM